MSKDGIIHAIVFLGKPRNNKIKISNEHSDFRWYTYEHKRT